MATQNVETKKNSQATKPTNLPSKVTPNGAVALTSDLEGAWGAEEATSEDIIIPKVLLMHGQSEKVLAGERQIGELVRSTDWEVIAKRGDTLNVIPFKMFKTWRVSEIVEGQAEWRREEPWNAANTDLEWDFTEKDVKTGQDKMMRRDQAYNFYVVLARDIESGMAFPVKLQFVRTSKKAGKLLADHFAKSNMFKVPPARQTFEIGTEFVNGATQKYFVFTSKMGNASSLEQIQAAKQWYDLIQKAGAAVKEHEVVERTAAPINEETAEY